LLAASISRASGHGVQKIDRLLERVPLLQERQRLIPREVAVLELEIAKAHHRVSKHKPKEKV